jgi:hypothetical protein
VQGKSHMVTSCLIHIENIFDMKLSSRKSIKP